MALREMLEVKSDVVKGDWRKQRNEELNDLYCRQDI
jgi:hypothetical protein